MTDTPEAQPITPVEKIRSALNAYRVLAWTTGVWLIALCYEMVLKYAVKVDNPPDWIGVVHGWVYFVYLLATANLAVKVRWPHAYVADGAGGLWILDVRTPIAPRVVGGVVLRRAFTEGSFVREGQLLFELDRKPFDAQVQAARGAGRCDHDQQRIGLGTRTACAS